MIEQKIIQAIFQHKQPESPKSIEAVFQTFRTFVSWQDFRQILVKYNFDLPTDLSSLQRRKKNINT